MTLPPGAATLVVAEAGINHSGSLETALKMVEAAKRCGVDAIKFQKRVPRLSVPRHMWLVPRQMPDGAIWPYIDYKEWIELPLEAYQEIDKLCRELSLPWFVSVWDKESLSTMLANFPDMPYIKIPSAHLTNKPLLQEAIRTDRPVVISTGMSTPQQIDNAMALMKGAAPGSIVCHCNSQYPCPPAELNLRCITWLKQTYPWANVGYSGHEVGLAPSLAAVALGAKYIERHFTLDRSMWGTDQAASVEPGGMQRLVKDIRLIEKALGDGVKRVYPGEEAAKHKMRLPEFDGATL